MQENKLHIFDTPYIFITDCFRG